MDTFVFLSTVRTEISELFKIPSGQITPEARLVEDLKFDSEDMHQLSMALEEVLSMEIDSEELFKLHTIGEVVNYLSNAARSHCVPHEV